MSKRFARILGSVAVVACVGCAWSASGDDGEVPAPAPLSPLPATPTDPGLAPPALPGLPVAPAGVPAPMPFDTTAGGFGNMGSAPAGAVPTPPPLTALAALDTTTTDTETTGIATAAPTELYEFLFRDDEEIGIVREKYLIQQADQLKDKEINRIFTETYTNPNQPGAAPGVVTAVGAPAAPVQPGQPNPADPRAGAAWDFYYEQLTMYDQYVKEKVLAGIEDLPELKYDAANALQEQTDLKKAYRDAAVLVVNEQRNENDQFYERLQDREDRRRDFYEWLAQQQRDMEEWTGLWARKINGARWADGEPVRRDDWYYGVDFNSAEPVAIRIDQQDYLLSRTPQEEVAQGQLNVLSSNLTPYDIVDMTGTLKNPDMERLRGTLVQPPYTVPSTEVPAPTTPGTVQLVP